MSTDSADEIMDATYRALCECGYADLTMRDIAAETDGSKAALHYHYGSKRSLLLAFLDHLSASFAERLSDPAGATATDRLRALLETTLTPPGGTDDAHQTFETALLELAAQAPYDPAIRERMQSLDRTLVERLRAEVASGVESGAFRAVDPDETARFLATAVEGAWTTRVAVGRDADCARRVVETYVETHLVADDTPDRDDSVPDRPR